MGKGEGEGEGEGEGKGWPLAFEVVEGGLGVDKALRRGAEVEREERVALPAALVRVRVRVRVRARARVRVRVRVS